MINTTENTIPMELRAKFGDIFDYINDTTPLVEIRDWSPKFSHEFERAVYCLMLVKLGRTDELRKMGWL